MACTEPHEIRPRHGASAKVSKEICHAEDPDCPHPKSVEQVKFTPQPMVDWLNPRQLISTGMKTMTAMTFGAYADKREMQAAMAVPPAPGALYNVDYDYTLEDGAARDELWFDYAADTGDGFAATYTMARLLAGDIAAANETLPQGRFVVLGGDQVYPTASREEYDNRLLGPFQAAYPWSRDKPYHHVYALPGNHDWYDGLTGFLRIFCQTRKAGDGGRWIGAWRTQQRRSYFALRLPHDWWIWGIDSQLESDLDRPQVEYFTQLAETMKRADKGPASQKIILMTAEPNWVFCGDDDARGQQCPINPSDFNTLMWLENRLIRTNGFSLPLVIAGDLHHYVRYTTGDGKTHRVTSGGGGAYLMGTHQMPAAIRLPEGTTETTVDQMTPVAYVQRSAYPDREVSKTLTAGIARLPRRNQNFSHLLGGVYAAFSLFALGHSAFAAIIAAAMVWAFADYTKTAAKHQPLAKRWQGWVHGLLHVALAVLAWWVSRTLAAPLHFLLEGLIVLLASYLTGYFGGAWLFAGYLLWSSRTSGAHTEEVFSSMALTGYKNFLRMHIDRAGALHVYAIGVDEVPTDYEFPEKGIGPNECGKPWFVSKSGAVAVPKIVDEIHV